MKSPGKTALLAAVLGLCAGGLVVLLWYLAAGPWDLVPFSFVDGSFFTGLVLLLLALMGLTKGGAGRNTNAGVSQSHNFGVSVAYATDLKIKNNGKQRERRGPTLWEAGLALLGAALACLLPFILSLLF